MLKVTLVIFAVLFVAYVCICVLAYVLQERLIFLPDRLDKKHQFAFATPFNEVFVGTDDGHALSGLLFKAQQSKGVIFYLHGNAGSLNEWGEVASTYLRFQYDIFMIDYRGYGKSEGTITDEVQLLHDVQQAYNYLLKSYEEREVIVLGYSLGSGFAAKIAAANQPRMLIMQAPYYSLTEVMRHSYPFLPTFLLKYKLSTKDALPDCKMPIVMFHGDQDEVIPYAQSLKLKELLKPGDTLITLMGVGHGGITYEPAYIDALESILDAQR
jgi:pimeloyl-ACP methyl ester carboxylesterase